MTSTRLANPRRTTLTTCTVRGEHCSGAATQVTTASDGTRPVCAACA